MHQTKIIYRDEKGVEHPIKYINVYGRVYRFYKKRNGEIILMENFNKHG